MKERIITKYDQAKRMGEVDEGLIPFLDYVNSLDMYVTTSSCMGRVALLSFSKGKSDAKHHRKWHRTVEFSEVKEGIMSAPEDKKLWLMCESFILHLFAKGFDDAELFMDITRRSGFKRTGILHAHRGFPFIEITGDDRFSLPVYDPDEGVLVGDRYLQYIVLQANKTLTRNYEKINRLLNNLMREFNP